MPPDPNLNTHRKMIVEAAAKLRLPAIYALRSAAIEGGLISYGVDIVDLFKSLQVTQIVFCVVNDRLTCQCNNRPSSKWSST